MINKHAPGMVHLVSLSSIERQLIRPRWRSLTITPVFCVLCSVLLCYYNAV